MTAEKINNSLKEGVKSFFKNDDNSYIENANQALRFLAKYRSALLANNFKEKYGTKIYASKRIKIQGKLVSLYRNFN